MMFPVSLNEEDLTRILYWHSVFIKTKEPEMKDEGPATKIKALLISMKEEDNEGSPGSDGTRRLYR